MFFWNAGQTQQLLIFQIKRTDSRVVLSSSNASRKTQHASPISKSLTQWISGMSGENGVSGLNLSHFECDIKDTGSNPGSVLLKVPNFISKR